MKTLLVVAVIATATSAAGSTLPFDTLCDTGVSNCTTESPVITGGVADSNFATILASAVLNPTVATPPYPIPFAWYQSGTNPIGTNTASWITVVGREQEPFTPGPYIYQQVIRTGTFAGMVPVTISGNWATDDCGTIAWGAVPVPVGGGTGTVISGGMEDCRNSSSASSSLTPFTFAEDVAGNTTYYLDFEVLNQSYVTGLLVDNLSASSVASTVPEPSSLFLLVSGVAVYASFFRRRPRGGQNHSARAAKRRCRSSFATNEGV